METGWKTAGKDLKQSQFIIVENGENIKEFDEEISGAVDRLWKGRYNSKKAYGGRAYEIFEAGSLDPAVFLFG